MSTGDLQPVSLLLKDKGFLEKELAKDGIKVVWVKTVSSSNATAVPQCRLDQFRLDRGGRPHRQDQRQPDQIGLRLFAAGMDRAGHRKGQQDRQRSRTSRVRKSRWCAAPIRTSSRSGRCCRPASPTRHHAGAVQQHADGGNLLIRGDVDAWAGLDR